MGSFGISWSAPAEVAASVVKAMLGDGENSKVVAIVCGLVVDADARAGHSSVPLAELAEKRPSDLAAKFGAVREQDARIVEGEAALPDLPTMIRVLQDASCVVGTGAGETPFVLEGKSLSTRKAWRETLIARNYLQRALQPCNPWSAASLPDGSPLNPQQRKAVEVMLTNRFSVLTGGPGTGKTFTLAQALALAFMAKPELRVKLAAPTGKAGARMGQSIAEAKKAFGDAATKIPEDGLTIHRLLEPCYDGTFKRNAENPLECDWLIVDEASMMDRSLFASLVEALPSDAVLTLVGDCDQLPSVSAGTVLADCCAVAKGQDRAGDAMETKAYCELAESRRFKPDGTIKKLSGLVNDGKKGDELLKALKETTANPSEAPDDNVVYWHEFVEPQPFGCLHWDSFCSLADSRFNRFLSLHGSDAETANAALGAIGDFCVLCALRRGRFGADAVTRKLAERYARKHSPKPVMVTVNHKEYEVNNGDVGVILYGDPDEVWFPAKSKGGALRTIPTALLPDLVPAWAITIHKSQGSEYENLAIILPDEGNSPVLTKEILYTGLTRVKKGGRVDIWGGAAALKNAATRAVVRWGVAHDAD